MLISANHGLLVIVVALLLGGCNVARDEHDAQEAAFRIHSQFTKGDFTSLHREATQHFKLRDERTFVSFMEQMRQEYGVMKKATVLAYQSGVDSNVGRSHVIISDLEFEKGARARERIILTRAADGQMRLWELLIEPSPD